MFARPARIRAALALLALLAAPALAAPPHGAAPKPVGPRLEQATFAMGCFWSAEKAFEGLPGVKSVISGFSGGTEKDPTYEEVGTGRTGHAESVKVTFDPAIVPYAKLLDVFWHNIDPMQVEGQFADHGHEYRTVIFYADKAQLRDALASRKALEASGRLSGPIATEIAPAMPFYPAEEYHQDFAKKNPAYYSAYRVGSGRARRLEALWGKNEASAGH